MTYASAGAPSAPSAGAPSAGTSAGGAAAASSDIFNYFLKIKIKQDIKSVLLNY